MSYNLQYSRFNERSILIEWPERIDERILKDLLNLKNHIQNHYIKQKVEVVNTYNSILIIYDYTIDKFNDEISQLKSLYSDNLKSIVPDSVTWEIPVCYDVSFAMDLELLCQQKGRSKAELIAMHAKPIYTVFFIGFLPGFLYLGGLLEQLWIDRKTVPNPHVKKGSVGIGGKQTGIYPQDSPGGWYIIGNSPIDFFLPQQQLPCFANPGDKIKFKAIDVYEHRQIQTEIKHSKFTLKSY